MKYELNGNTFRNKNGILKDLKNIIELEKNRISYIPPKRNMNNNSLNRYLIPRVYNNNNYFDKNTKQINTNKDGILNVFLVRHCYSCANKMKKGGFLNKYLKRHFISPMCTSIGLRNSLKTGMAFRNNKQFQGHY